MKEKQRNNRVWALLLALMVALCGLAACGANKADMEPGEGYYEYTEDASVEEVESEAPGMAENGAAGATDILISGVDTDRKLIYEVTLDISTETYDEDYGYLKGQLSASGGYVASEYTWGTAPESSADSGRSTSLTLKVPVEKLEQFLSAVEGSMEIVSRRMEVQDTTDYYFDTESRIELLEDRYERLKGYLKESTNMEDIISLETEMSDILYQLDDLKGTKRGLDDRIAYSTVYIELNEVVKAAQLPVQDKDSIWDRAGDALTVTSRGVVAFLEGFIVVLIGALPILGVLGVIAIITVVIVKLSIKAARKRKANQPAQPPKAKGIPPMPQPPVQPQS